MTSVSLHRFTVTSHWAKRTSHGMFLESADPVGQFPRTGPSSLILTSHSLASGGPALHRRPPGSRRRRRSTMAGRRCGAQ